MSNELIQNHSNELVETLNQNGGVDKLLKPLIREIHLFDTYIAGTTHLEDPSILLPVSYTHLDVYKRQMESTESSQIG